MKKTLVILLAVLMLLSMAACSKSKESAKAAEPAAPAVTDAPTAAPTAAPTNTPAPTEVPADVAVVNALKKLDDLSSMHMDMTMLMDMSLQIAYQGMTMNMPIQMTMDYLMDVQKEPYMSKMDVKMDMNMASYGQQTNTALVYMDLTGDKPAGYSSTDGGATWTFETEDMEKVQPQESIAVLKGNVKDFEKTGTETVDGKAVTVYSGRLDGKYAQEIMATTGMEELLSELDVNDPTGGSTALGDILVTVYVDDETGYPVYYAMDMTEMLKDVLGAAMKQAMGMEGMEGMEVTLDVPAIKVDCSLSQFDSVEPIVIPEAALAAANN